MYRKLAVRNVRRQIGNYLIYFMTVAFTVALMFAISNVIFSPQLDEVQDKDFQNFLTGITVFISLIVAWVLSYATSFMLRMRKREFGTYLTLGMKRNQILRIFLGETLVMCGAALALGILFGLLIYQCFMALIARLMEVEMAFASYSLSGLGFTVVLVICVFLLSSLSSALYLKRVRISELVYGEKKVERQVKHPLFWFLAAVVSLILMITSVIIFRGEVRALALNSAQEAKRLVLCFFVFSVSIVCFHIGIARGAVYVLLKNKSFCNKRSNTFVARQLGASLGANAVMMGVLAFLLSMTVIGADIAFVQRVGEEELLEQSFPYDIMYIGNMKDDTAQGKPIPQEEAEAVISEYTKITHKYDYHLYESGEDTLFRATKWSREGYAVPDIFMKESDFNALITPLGHEPVRLDGEYLIVFTRNDDDAQADWEQIPVTCGQKSYRFGGSCSGLENLISNLYLYFYVVIPDEAVEEMDVMADAAVYNIAGDDFDVSRLEFELTYEVTEEQPFGYGGMEESGAGEMTEKFTYYRIDYYFKAAMERDAKQNGAIYVTGILYAAAVFFLVVLAILALKTLSGLSENRQRFRILYRLGADRREQSRALFLETFCFFFLPFGVPALLSIPAALIGTDILRLNNLSRLSGQIFLVSGSIFIILAVIYSLYYLAAYTIARRAIIEEREP